MTLVDEFGCTDSIMYVDYLTIFGPEANPSWTQSAGQCGQLVTFNLADTSNVSNIVWNLGNGSTMNDSITFTYQYTSINSFVPTVTVSDDNNCQVIYPMDTIYMFDNGLTAYFSANPLEADLGEEITLTDLSSSTTSVITNWNWFIDSYGNYFNTSGTPIYLGYGIPGFYEAKLLVIDDNGCIDTYTQIIHVTGDLEIPNVFTPNGDGINDFFSFKYDIFQSFDILIVNRWGNVIIDGQGVTGTQFWNGNTKSGAESPDGVYFYKFAGTLKDGVTKLEKDGFVTLVRH